VTEKRHHLIQYEQTANLEANVKKKDEFQRSIAKTTWSFWREMSFLADICLAFTSALCHNFWML
jgi:hypothetical protein